MAFLIGHPEGAGAPRVQEVQSDRLRIGRGTNAGLRLDHPSVDWEHATIERDERGFRLADAASATGTYLNGEKIDAAYLHDGDAIGIGPFVLNVRESPGLLGLAVERLLETAETEPTVPTAATPFAEVDYARAYRLTRPFLTKAALALFATLAAAAALVAIPAVGAFRAFQPGALNEAHERGKVACFQCHAPWSGPARSRCSECHQRAAHQPRQAFEPGCSDCHFEHRGERSLTVMDDRGCVRCHGALEIAGGGEPKVARAIRSFPAGHPDFSLPKTDPALLRFGHAKHLTKPVRTPEGTREQLVCADCHLVAKDGGPTGMKPVSFETACARCHELTFDNSRPDKRAPHEEPQRVREYLYGIYSDQRAAVSVPEQRRRLVRSSGVGRIDYSTPAVIEAERYLYGIACQKCHSVDMEATPVPAVTLPRVPPRWLIRATFPHDRHVDGIACADCHDRAAASAATSDVLIPGIDACAGCHGGDAKPPGQAKRRPGPDDCRSCHVYHPQGRSS